MRKYQVAGYVKLAKLWETKRDKAIAYHKAYYERKYKSDERMELVGVYVDITGNKHVYHRNDMLRLLNDCRSGKVNCIAAQTSGYLAPNLEEFCYLYSYISELNIDIAIITEDSQYQINTIDNPENQGEALARMARQYTAALSKEYAVWKYRLEKRIEKVIENERGAANG